MQPCLCVHGLCEVFVPFDGGVHVLLLPAVDRVEELGLGRGRGLDMVGLTVQQLQVTNLHTTNMSENFGTRKLKEIF